MDVTSAQTLIKATLQQPYFAKCEDGKAPIDVTWDAGDSNVIVVTGENASGKSFLRRILTSICDKLNWTCLSVSLESRQRPAEIQKVEVYGDERYQATGLNSLRAYVGSVRAAKLLAGRKKPYAMIWDEPDCGLSESAAVGLGKSMFKFLKRKCDKLQAAVVISHSKPLIRELSEIGCHHLRLAGCPDLQTWLNESPRCIEPEELLLAAAERYKRIRPVVEKIEGSKKTSYLDSTSS